MYKKVLSIIMCISIITCIFASEGIYAEAGSSDFEYTVLNDGSIKINKYIGKDANVVIPDSIGEKSVSAIGYAAFDKNIKSVYVGKNVKDINDDAFTSTSGKLKGIEVSNDNSVYSSVSGVLFSSNGTELKYYPKGIENKEYTLPEGVVSIAKNAFNGCAKLYGVNVPNSVKSIGENAFYNCKNLVNIHLGTGVQYIGENAFKNTGYYFDNSNWDKKVLYIDDYLLYSNSEAKKYTIRKGTKVIGAKAFFLSNVGSVTFPKSIKYICNGAFSRSDIKSLKIPDSVERIGNAAFYNCYRLTSVVMPDSLKVIEEYSFFKCRRLKKFNLPKRVNTIGRWAFYGCDALKSISVPKSLHSIDYGVFSGCKGLKKINVVKANKYYSSVNGVLFDKKKKLLYCYPDGKKLKSYTLPKAVKRVCMGAFYECENIESITLPGGTKIIGFGAFFGCKKLRKINVPKKLRFVRRKAFMGCSKLRNVIMPKSMKWGKLEIDGGNNLYFLKRLPGANFAVKAGSKGTIRVKLNRFNGADKLQFRYKSINDTDWKIAKIKANKNKAYFIKKLSDYTEYQISVRRRMNGKWSNWGYMQKVRTVK